MKLAIFERRTTVIGGNQTYIRLLMSQQGLPRLQTTLIVPCRDRLTHLLGPDVDVRVLDGGKRPPGALTQMLRLATVLRDMPAETTLMCNNRVSAAIGLPAALLAGRRAVWFVKVSSRGGFSNMVLALLSDRVLAIAPQVFDRMPGYARRVLRRRAVDLPIGADLTRFLALLPPPVRPGLRLCVLSRLHEQKAPHLLLDALAVLGSDADGIEIDLYGDTPEHQRAYAEAFTRRVAAEAPQRVRLKGWIDDVVPALAQSDAVALPSRTEGFPRSLVEAMAAARPVLATAVGGVPDLVADGRTGFIVPVDDAAALAARLVWLRDHPAERVAMGEAARDHARENYDFAVHLARLDSLLAGVQGRGGLPS